MNYFTTMHIQIKIMTVIALKMFLSRLKWSSRCSCWSSSLITIPITLPIFFHLLRCHAAITLFRLSSTQSGRLHFTTVVRASIFFLNSWIPIGSSSTTADLTFNEVTFISAFFSFSASTASQKSSL